MGSGCMMRNPQRINQKLKKKVEEKKTKHRGGSSAGNLLFSDRVIYTILTVKALSSLCDVQRGFQNSCEERMQLPYRENGVCQCS